MIRNKKEFYNGLPADFDGPFDWDWLKPAWCGKIEPSDIDGNVERNDNILMFETKNPGVPVKEGQRILLEALIRIGQGRIEVMVLNDKGPAVSKMEHWYWNGERIEKTNHPDINYIFVIKKASEWFDKANGSPIIREWKGNQVKCFECNRFYDPGYGCVQCRAEKERQEFIKHGC